MPIFIGFLSELAYKAVFRWRCVSVKLGFERKVVERHFSFKAWSECRLQTVCQEFS
ncbi:protein of unknown function [Pseudomonas mediterranea]|jgi:hypothetical protein